MMGIMHKPGAGWKFLGSAVYEHSNGARIHVGGLVRLPDKTFVSLNRFPEGDDGWSAIRMCGGNRKRGLMVWANNLVSRMFPKHKTAPKK